MHLEPCSWCAELETAPEPRAVAVLLGLAIEERKGRLSVVEAEHQRRGVLRRGYRPGHLAAAAATRLHRGESAAAAAAAASPAGSPRLQRQPSQDKPALSTPALAEEDERTSGYAEAAAPAPSRPLRRRTIVIDVSGQSTDTEGDAALAGLAMTRVVADERAVRGVGCWRTAIEAEERGARDALRSVHVATAPHRRRHSDSFGKQVQEEDIGGREQPSPRGPVTARSFRRLADGRFDWRRGGILGVGGFGIVHIGQNMQSGELMAVKQVDFDPSQAGTMRKLQQLQTEIAVMKRFRHPSIVEYWGTHREGNSIFIFMEYVPGGSIAELLNKFGAFSAHVCAMYTRTVLEGLYYLHAQGCIHRDIKGANILVGVDGQAKLADFGSAALLTGIKGETAAGFQGTTRWMSPEVAMGQGGTAAADVWAIGCTVIEMLTGKPPWDHVSESAVEVLQLLPQWTPRPPIPQLPVLALAFVTRCLVADPEGRPTSEELYDDPFLAFSGDMANGANLARWVQELSMQLGRAAAEGPSRDVLSQLLSRSLAVLNSEVPAAARQCAGDPKWTLSVQPPSVPARQQTMQQLTAISLQRDFPTADSQDIEAESRPTSSISRDGGRCAVQPESSFDGAEPKTDALRARSAGTIEPARVRTESTPPSTAATLTVPIGAAPPAAADDEQSGCTSPAPSPFAAPHSPNGSMCGLGSRLAQRRISDASSLGLGQREFTLCTSPMSDALSFRSGRPGRRRFPPELRPQGGNLQVEHSFDWGSSRSLLSSLQSASLYGTMRTATANIPLHSTVRSYLSMQDQAARHTLHGAQRDRPTADDLASVGSAQSAGSQDGYRQVTGILSDDESGGRSQPPSRTPPLSPRRRLGRQLVPLHR